MTYSLNTLNADRAERAPSGLSRFTQEIGLVLGAAGLLFWLLALLSHSLADPAWSTSGRGPQVSNWAGQVGALLADASYYLLGFTVWVLFLAGVRAWLSALAGWLRSSREEAAPADAGPQRWWQRPAARRAGYWLSLFLLLCACAVLEWSRLHRWESALPDHAGGVLGMAIASAIIPVVSGASNGMIALPTIPAQTWGVGLGLMVAIGLIVGALPATRAMRLKIVDALAGR